MGLVQDFYEGRVVHPKGFTLEYVLGWDDGVLETEHSYIQWLFPLTEPSHAGAVESRDRAGGDRPVQG